MEQIIQEFYGFSKSKILKIKKDNNFFVRKFENIQRNIERYEVLKEFDISMPKILKIEKNYYDMEFIESIDMIKFVSFYDIDLLLEFLKNIFNTLKHVTVLKNYINTYEEKLNYCDFSFLVF